MSQKLLYSTHRGDIAVLDRVIRKRSVIATHSDSPAHRFPIDEVVDTEGLTDENNRGANLLMIATNAERMDVIEYLLCCGANPNLMSGKRRWGCLYSAAWRNLCEPATFLLAGNADINHQCCPWLMATPLLAAAHCGQTEMVRWLLAHHADPNIECQRDADTPLQAAAYTCQVEAVQVLLDAGVPVDQPSSRNNRTALTMTFSEEVTALLMERGANINHAIGTSYETILHIAAKENRARQVALLLRHGADFTLKALVPSGNQGICEWMTPLAIAKAKGRGKSAQVLWLHIVQRFRCYRERMCCLALLLTLLGSELGSKSGSFSMTEDLNRVVLEYLHFVWPQ